MRWDPSTLSQARRDFWAPRAVLVPGRGICLVAANALLSVSTGWRLSVAKLGCPPLPHVQICVSEPLQGKKCPHYRAVGTVLEGVGSARSKYPRKRWKIS